MQRKDKMQQKDHSQKKRKHLTSEDLKRRLYERGIHGNSMPSIKSPLTMDKSHVLYVNLNSSLNKRDQNQSPKILKKTASAFGKAQMNKSLFPSITPQEFQSKKKSPVNKFDEPNSPVNKTAINFYSYKRTDTESQEEVVFNSSFYKNDSSLRQNETRMTKRLVEKMSGHMKKDENSRQKSKFFNEQEGLNSGRQKQKKDEIIEKETEQGRQQQHQSQQSHSMSLQSSSLEEYISLITKNIPNIDEFLYLVRHSSLTPESDNIYQLEIIDYQQIKSKDKQPNFEYYTISKKGFCHYLGGKPIQFIELKQWLQQKQIYEKIKKLNFFSRFRRWKTIKMWIKKVIRHRIEKCSTALQQKLFILNPTVRTCILDINSINLEMEKSLSIISRNEGTYTLQSFKHCQEKTRRQAASIVEQFSRRSRQSVKKCFEESLQNLKEILKTKNSNEDKNFAATSHNPKDNAFQVLGFPAKMSYEHRSKLRKLTGRFVRFSYLVDFIHLNGLASIFKTQIESFSLKLNTLQIESEVEVHYSREPNKQNEENEKEKMFNIQLIFRPCEVSEHSISQVPMEIFDISMKIDKAGQIFNPLYHIKEKSLIESSKKLIKQEAIRPPMRRYIENICDLWLTLKPTLDNIFDELSFLIKESMASLKYFERWSKHREMQKYINILEEWDDIVSQNWEISQNDNLDPISIIENLESSMSKIKEMIQISENKLTEKIIEFATEPLNVYWENTLADVDQLITNPNIQNSAETIEFYLAYMNQNTEKFEHQIPTFIDLGIFSINLEKMKHQIIDFMRNLADRFKENIPTYVEDHTNSLNFWLAEKSTRLRQQIHNIDDFVRLNKSLKEIDTEFNQKKDLCSDLGHIYQTMYNYKIESKKRKQFEVNTLKAKDQLEQLLINVEQNIQRKTELFTKEVSRYHIPNLIKEIQKISDNITSEEFQSLKSSSPDVIRKLLDIKNQYQNLKLRKSKCLEYLSVVKLSEIQISELDELQRQINSRLEMWENMEIFDKFIEKINSETVSEMDLETVRNFVNQKRAIVGQIESTHNKPNNEVLQLLKQKVEKYFINIPLLQGFNDKLSEGHWEEISQILKDYPYLDLRKKEFTLKKFLDTEIGKQAKKIEYIFGKAKVENELQLLYSEVQNSWMNTLVKSKVESKFIIISNPQVMRESFDYMFRTLSTILSNPFSSTLRQYSITYDSLTQYYNSFEYWMSIQERLLKIDSRCKLLDVKKLSDYSQFQNCEKIYKNVMKLFSNRNVENGVKMSKLFVNGLDEKLQEMDECLKKMQDNIRGLLEQHRKNYPPFYLFEDERLFKIITEPSNPTNIEQTAKFLLPSIEKLQFEGERISGIYNFDQEKCQGNTISTTFDIEKILLQLFDTTSDFGRKTMRWCRYKAVEVNLVKLVPQYQAQYLLAINKIDFTNYTEISIDNQIQVSDSLKEFYKVMRKDITEDLKIRNTIKPELLPRYDILILQTLYHEELLGSLIKKNIIKTTDFEWQNQLRFYWDESSNDENNIVVKHCHAKMKYGNEYIGSKSKVVVSSDINLIFSLSFAQKALFLGSQHGLERVLNFIGHRMAIYDCSTFSTLKSVTNFLIGHWYSQTTCFYKNFDFLQSDIRHSLLDGSQHKLLKESLLKKTVFNVKENDKRENAVFLGVSHESKAHDFRGKCRVVQHVPINLDQVKNLLKIKGIFDQQISDFLLKIFEMVNYLQEKSSSFNISLEHFLETKLQFTQNITKTQIFEQLVHYVRPKMGLDNVSILEETVRLYLTSQASLDNQKDQIIQKIGSNSKTLQKYGKEKEKSGSKRSLRVRESKIGLSKSQEKSPKHNKPKVQKQKTHQQDEDIQKYDSIKQALGQRNILILTGTGKSKLHCIKNIYSKSHKIVEIFSFSSTQTFKQGLITQNIANESESNVLLYFDGINSNLLQELEEIWNNVQYLEVKNKIIEKNILLVIGVQKLAHFDYSKLSSFYLINVQLQSEYLIEMAREWSEKELETDKERQKLLKFIGQTLIATFDNWAIKDIKQREKNIFVFLTHLKSLLPAQNLLDALVYCFIRVFSNLDTDYIKLEFLVKKFIGEDRIGEDEKVYDYIYCILNNEEGLHNVKKFHDKYIEFSHSSSKNSSVYLDHVITPQIYHNCTIMHRVLQKTSTGIYLVGPVASGKSTIYQIFKHLNYSNKSFLKITMCDNSSKDKFVTRILKNFDVFSLKEMKSKLNYEKAIVMIDDISMTEKQQGLTEDSSSKSFNEKLTFVKQLLQYGTLQYPAYYPTSIKCIFQKRNFSLSQVNFILSGQEQLDQFKECTIPLELGMQEVEIKSIFSHYLRQRLPYMEVSDLMINDMASTTLDICKKIGAKSQQFDGLELAAVKAILSKFIMLKTKESSTGISKEVQRYWVYLLYEHLSIYEHCKKSSEHSKLNNEMEDSIIMKELKTMNLDEHKPNTLCYSFLQSKNVSSGNGGGKKLQFVKELKKIFNAINERIQKYNESQNKRYGQQFDYIHFDELIRKIVKLTNNLPIKDYLLCGRKGTGKETLIKLVAYLQGSNFKPVIDSTLKSSIIDIFANTNITTMSSYLICKHLSSKKDIEDLKEFYYTDFENQLLNSKELDKPIKIFLKEKEKEQKLASTSLSVKTQQKTYGSLGFSNPEYYIAPRPKISQEDSILYRSAIRMIFLTNNRALIRSIPINVKTELMFDEMEEIPVASVQEYNVKFLDAEEVKYAPRTSKLLAEIWTFSKYELQLSLKAYDDAIRLFSSFMTTLYDEIKAQLNNFGKVMELYSQLRKLNQKTEAQVEKLQQKIRTVNELLAAEETEERKTQKQQIETEMHKKSTSFSKCQKIIEMLAMLIPFFKEKHSVIYKYVMDKEFFEESLVVASCYFTFLSERSFVERRKILSKWYNNGQISQLMDSQPINSFLTLFNLTKEEFNADPIDDLQDFYENMAIVFNSVKPVIIKDKAKRGKQWLESVCTFVVVSEKQTNFVDVVCEHLSKTSNILIEITNQQTMNNISSSFINTLLYLGDSTETINIKGQDLSVNPEAKFYVLLGECVTVPPELKDDFTVVSFSESETSLQKSLEYSYMSTYHPEVFFSGLEVKKRIRAHKLQREALMEQIAECIYASFDSGKDSTNQLEDQSKSKLSSEKESKLDDNQSILKKSKEQLEANVMSITDKIMTRAQNLANKLKEKDEVCRQLEHKQSNNPKLIKQANEFISQCKNLFNILQFMAQRSQTLHEQKYFYTPISHQELVKKITSGLRRGFIHTQNRVSLYLFAIKMWGCQYVENDFWVFLLAIFQMIDQMSEIKSQKLPINSTANEEKLSKKLLPQEKLTNNDKFKQFSIDHHKILKQCQSYEEFKFYMQNQLEQILSKFSHQQLLPYLQFTGTITNLQEGDDRKIIVNNIWLTGKDNKYSQKVEEGLKVVHLEVKDSSSPQNEIKKYIFDENILVISSAELLEQALQHLQKLGSHEKTIYFKCPMASKNIKQVIFLSKKYNVTELNHIYENKNTIFSQCLQKLERQRQMNKISSATNIKSFKNISANNLESNKKISENNKANEEKKAKEEGGFSSKLTDGVKMKGLNEEMESVKITKGIKTQKMITCVQSPEDEQVATCIEEICAKFYSFLREIYNSCNLVVPFTSENEHLQLSEYLKNCNTGEQQEFEFSAKVRLLCKIIELFKKQPYAVINTEIVLKITELKSLLDNVIKEFENPLQQARDYSQKLDELFSQQYSNAKNILLEAFNKAKRVKFQNQYLSYFRIFFTDSKKQTQDENDPFDLQNIMRRSRKIYDSIKNINDQPIAVKRNSRKSINVIFKKEDLKQKMSGPAVANVLSNNSAKKTGLRRLSKQSIQAMTTRKQSDTVVSQDSDLAPLLLEIEYKKLCSKTTALTDKIDLAIRKLPETQSVELILLILEDRIPGTWLFQLEHTTLTLSLSSLFKKYIRLQEDMGFSLEKIKRSRHAQVDFSFLRYSKDFIQLHFRKKIYHSDHTVYIIGNSPTSEELEACEDYLKIASIQGAGWKFSSEPNVVDIFTGVQKPMASEGKILTSCYFMRKQNVQMMNLVAIDVYESRASPKPIMKVYANCKKQTTLNSANNLMLYLKEEANA